MLCISICTVKLTNSGDAGARASNELDVLVLSSWVRYEIVRYEIENRGLVSVRYEIENRGLVAV